MRGARGPRIHDRGVARCGAPHEAGRPYGGVVERNIRTIDDVLALMDSLFAPAADRWTAGAASWWDRFYTDRDRPVPFFAAKPDESLVSYLEHGLIPTGRTSESRSCTRHCFAA